MKMATSLPEDNRHRAFFRKIIPLYANALKNHLRGEENRIKLFDNLFEHVLQKLDMEKHDTPNRIAAFMFRHTGNIRQEQILDGYQLLALNAELESFTDVCGACERIKGYPDYLIPTAYLSKNLS